MRSIYFLVAASLFVMGIFAGNRNIYPKTQNDNLRLKEEVLSDVDDSEAGVIKEEFGPTLIPFPTLVTMTLPKPTITPTLAPVEEVSEDIEN